MEKMQKSAAAAEKILSFLFWFLLIALGIGVLCSIFIMLFYKPPVDAPVSLTVGFLNFNLKEDLFPAIDNRIIAANLAVIVIDILVFLHIIKVVQKILQPISQEKPFAHSVSADVRSLAWTELIGTLLIGIGHEITARLFYSVYGMDKLFFRQRCCFR